MGKYSAARDLDLSNKTQWYVVASRTGAVIYASGTNRKFQFLERITNPRGHLTETELDSDRPGRGFSSASSGQIRHALDRRSHRHEEQARRFARLLGKTLERAHREARFGSLVLVAEPHFLGLLREGLTPAVQRAVSHEIRHQYSEGSDEELKCRILSALAQES